MEKLQYENNDYVLYSPDSLKYVTNNMIDILNKKLDCYRKLFGVDKFRKVQINYFDNKDRFRKYIYKLRGENKSLPEYAQGTFDNGMINAYIDPSLSIGSDMYKKRLYLASHELFHIMYKELIWQNNYDRITWFDEGMAQYFSGEYDELLNNDFDAWASNVISSTKIIPNLNELKHNYNFVTDEYNGYKLSLIAIKYMHDILSIDFKLLVHNPKEIIRYGDAVLEEVINYFQEKHITRVQTSTWPSGISKDKKHYKK